MTSQDSRITLLEAKARLIAKLKQLWATDRAKIVLALAILVGGAFPLLALLPAPFSFMEIGDAQDIGSLISGTTGVLFSLVGLYLLYITYTSQKEELKAARSIANAQAETLIIQQFESIFFKMIELNRAILNDIKIEKVSFEDKSQASQLAIGTNAINLLIKDTLYLYNHYTYDESKRRTGYDHWYTIMLPQIKLQPENTKRIINNIIKMRHSDPISARAALALTWSNLYLLYMDSIKPFILNTYYLMKFIDEYQGFDDIIVSNRRYTKREVLLLKRRYFRILRSTWSGSTAIMMFLNSNLDEGQNMKPILHNYNMLQNISPYEFKLINEIISILHPYLIRAHMTPGPHSYALFNDFYNAFQYSHLVERVSQQQEDDRPFRSTYLWYHDSYDNLGNEYFPQELRTQILSMSRRLAG